MKWHIFHAWEVRASEPMHRVITVYGLKIDGSPKAPITEVLMACRCGKLRTITLDGHWTVEQIKGAS